MTERVLRPELVSLIHHVELNKAGWWDGAIQQLILAAIWLAGRPLTSEGIRDALRDGFSVAPDPTQIDKQIGKLSGSGRLVRLPGGELKISEQSFQQLEQRLRESEAVDSAAKNIFN